MNIGFLRSAASMDQLQDEMSELERADCQRIIVDNNTAADPHEGMLGAIMNRLSAGDGLIVLSLDSLANTMPQLIDLILELDAKDVRLRSLTEGFDTQGRNRALLKAILEQLQQYQTRLEERLRKEAANHLGRRVGRPRALTTDEIESARSLIKEGHTMDEVAQRFRISRATLYRYLEEASKWPGT